MTTSASGEPLRVLLVEDDAGIGRVITNGFRDRGIDLTWLRTGLPALQRLQAEPFDAVVLDLMLPDVDGFALCRELRAAGIDTPVCMLTARDALEDKLEGFELGADDYLTKPFAIDELVARLGALARRAPADPARAAICCGALRVDPAGREAAVNGVVLPLTRREFDVLALLVQGAHQVVSRERLLQVVWGAGREVTLNTVDVYVGYLRRKLGAVEGAPEIQSVRGIGFKLR
jgi:DNA-binding response OmpR family regulator